jgi:hypothetical protein
LIEEKSGYVKAKAAFGTVWAQVVVRQTKSICSLREKGARKMQPQACPSGNAALWPSVISFSRALNLYSSQGFMPFLNPAPEGQRRAERVRFDEAIPAVVRFSDGNRTSGKLKVVSLTGGLLSLACPVRQGSVGKLMFLTPAGSVLGSAEMLTPMSWELQPFRFVAFAGEDHDRLGTAIQSYLQKNRKDDKQLKREHEQIENFRAW